MSAKTVPIVNIHSQLFTLEELQAELRIHPWRLEEKEDGNTPLISSTKLGKIAVVEFLLSLGANIHEKDEVWIQYYIDFWMIQSLIFEIEQSPVLSIVFHKWLFVSSLDSLPWYWQLITDVWIWFNCCFMLEPMWMIKTLKWPWNKSNQFCLTLIRSMLLNGETSFSGNLMLVVCFQFVMWILLCSVVFTTVIVCCQIGYTALMIAAREGHSGVSHLLINAGASVHDKSKFVSIKFFFLFFFFFLTIICEPWCEADSFSTDTSWDDCFVVCVFCLFSIFLFCFFKPFVIVCCVVFSHAGGIHGTDVGCRSKLCGQYSFPAQCWCCCEWKEQRGK